MDEFKECEICGNCYDAELDNYCCKPMKDKEQERALEAYDKTKQLNEALENHIKSEQKRIGYIYKTFHPDDIFDLGLRKGFEWQQSQQPKPSKSLEECKDEVAKKDGLRGWWEVSKHHIETYLERAAELYASQREEQAVKVALKTYKNELLNSQLNNDFDVMGAYAIVLAKLKEEGK